MISSTVQVACDDRTVYKVLILTPDKDLGQCVQGERFLQVDHRNNVIIDEDAVNDSMFEMMLH